MNEEIRNQYLPYEGLLDQFNGSMSSKCYRKSDCNIVRYKELSVTYYDEQMGDSYWEDDPWESPPPDTIFKNFIYLIFKFLLIELITIFILKKLGKSSIILRRKFLRLGSLFF